MLAKPVSLHNAHARHRNVSHGQIVRTEKELKLAAKQHSRLTASKLELTTELETLQVANVLP